MKVQTRKVLLPKSARPSPVASIPTWTMLEAGDLPVRQLAAFALREGRRPRPIYTAHKWFARRLGCVFRAILIGATSKPKDDFWAAYYGDANLKTLKVLDPFVGGGTSVVEASRLGATTFGTDVDPVACAVTRLELHAGLLPDLKPALARLQETVGKNLSPYHKTRDSSGQTHTVLHHFWVQVVRCADCRHQFEAHPNFRLAEDGKHQWAFCSACHEIHRLPAAQNSFRCAKCANETEIDAGRVVYGTVECPKCRLREPLIEIARRTTRPPHWRMFASEVIPEQKGTRAVPMRLRKFLRTTGFDDSLYEDAHKALRRWKRRHPGLLPTKAIRAGRTDSRLIDYGYRKWTDLFNARQLLHLSMLAEAIRQFEGPTRMALSMAFSDHLTTNCLQASYASGWRRLTPLFGVRAFRHVPRPVEINPWSDGTGRGTFPNTIRGLARAAEFARNPKEPYRGGFRQVSVIPADDPPLITNTAAQGLNFLEDESIDIVLTDPPYFDNIAYSELAEFFVPWLENLDVIKRRGTRETIMLHGLGGKRGKDRTLDKYTTGLGGCFREVARVLKPTGLVAFSFRHAVPEAWLALANAIASNPLRVAQVLPAPGEAGVGLHVHEGSGVWDAVFVLRKNSRPRSSNELRVSTPQQRQVDRMVTAWKKKLYGAPLPFTKIDQLALRRACLISAALISRDAKTSAQPGTRLRDLLSEPKD